MTGTPVTEASTSPAVSPSWRLHGVWPLAAVAILVFACLGLLVAGILPLQRGTSLLSFGLPLAVAISWSRLRPFKGKHGSLRLPIRFAFAAAACGVAGSLLGAMSDWVGLPPQFSFVAALMFLGSQILWVLALLTWPSDWRPRDGWAYFVLDTGIIGLAAALLVWYYKFGPGVPPASTTGLVGYSPFVISMFSLVGVSLAALRRPSSEFMLPFQCLVSSVTIVFVFNFGFAALNIPDTWATRIGLPLLVLIYLAQIGSSEAIRLGWRWPGRTAAGTVSSPIPTLAVAAVGFLVFNVGMKERNTGLGPVLIVALALTLMMLLRQTIMARQNARLIAERAAHETDARIAALVRHTSDVILIVDEQLRIRFASPSIETLWNGDPHQLLGRDIRDLVDQTQRSAVDLALADRLTHPGQSDSARWRMKGADGSWRKVEAVITNLLHEPSVNGIVLTLRDHTERAELEEQLQQAQKMEAVGQLAGGIAHDFNNLLTSVLGHSDLVIHELEPNNPVQEDLAHIKHAAESAASLTRQLLAFGRKQIVEPRVIDIRAGIEQIANLLRRLIEERVTTIVHVAPDAGHIRLDPSQLEQVVLNLAINARDAMPNGGTLTIAARHEHVGTEIHSAVIPIAPGDYLRVDVGDTGSGMDSATQARIFEPFFTTKPPGRGTGLGLASVYGILKQNRGGLILQSEPGRGSTFSVFFPRLEEGRAEAVPAEDPTSTAGRASATILVVEDEASLREIARKVLTREGFRVLVASDAIEARTMVANSPVKIDLLLTDVVMPGVSGPRLAAALLQDRPKMRVLFMSGYGGADLAGELLPEERLLRKPFTPIVLLEHVRAALEDRAVSTPR